MAADRDTEELLRIVRIYVPSAVAPQLLGDLERSRAAERLPGLRDLLRRTRLAAQGPDLSWRQEQ